ncbi:MAG: hypothetical protein CFE38_07920 [Comamonadaceae bacterium PBBC1]|nr:MAG: hypothetical protein CFE38_07920 [Comamonadaceae bacterium PBBC1]
MSTKPIRKTTSGNDVYTSSDSWIDGLAGNDGLTGAATSQTLIGGLGLDRIRGMGGDDILWGNTTNRAASASSKSNDVFVFEATRQANGFDTLMDYRWSDSKKSERDVLDLSLALKNFSSKNDIQQYAWLVSSDQGAVLWIDQDGAGSGTAQSWARLEGVVAGDKVRIQLNGNNTEGDYTLKVLQGGPIAPPSDTTAPSFSPATPLSYQENQIADAVVATVAAATDNVGVTQYMFLLSNNARSATSEDGFFSINASGQISMTALGVAADVNNFEAGASNAHIYNIVAGDQAGNWSNAVAVTLNETNATSDDTSALSIAVAQSGDDIWNAAGTAIISATDYILMNKFPEGTSYRFFVNTIELAAPTELQVGQSSTAAVWDDDTQFRVGDVVKVIATFGGIEYTTEVFAQGDTVGPALPDTTAPTFSSAPPSLSYQENQSTDAVVATVTAAIDDVGVTQYMFLLSDNSRSATSEDGFFNIDASGQIKITATGIASEVNNFEAGASNAHSYNIVAGDLANNWSSAVAVTLNETNDTGDDTISVYVAQSGDDANGLIDTDYITFAPTSENATFKFYVNSIELTTSPTQLNHGPYTTFALWDDDTQFGAGDTVKVVATLYGIDYIGQIVATGDAIGAHPVIPA